MKSSLKSLTLSIAIGTLLAIPGAFADERVPDIKEITQMAKSADTPAEHERVARSYVLHARALEFKAEKLEREVQAQRTGPTRGMEQKWPGLIKTKRQRNEQLAMQTRRAAEESLRLAEYHSKLAGRTLEQIATLD
jgi:hypothetical protein